MKVELKFHALLIVGSTEEERRKEAEFVAAEVTCKHGREDIYRIDEKEGTIGIDKIRNLKEWASLKPSRGQNKAAIILNAENMTLEAQNALLKTLEEPSESTIIILTSRSKMNLLPTIVSRCFVKEIRTTPFSKSGKPRTADELTAQRILKLSPKEKLELTEKYSKLFSDRSWVLSLIDRWLLELRDMLINTPNEAEEERNLLRLLEELLKTKQQTEGTAVNTRLAAENLLLNFFSLQ